MTGDFEGTNFKGWGKKNTLKNIMHWDLNVEGTTFDGNAERNYCTKFSKVSLSL